MVQANLANFYLFVNSPLEPLDSTLTIFQDQFFVLAFVALILSIVISLFISTKLSRPIVQMKHSANELAKGHYDIHFDGSLFQRDRSAGRYAERRYAQAGEGRRAAAGSDRQCVARYQKRR